MSRARVGMAAALLAACGVAGIARAGNVDIFPSQSWDSLSRATRKRRTDKDRTRMRTRRPPPRSGPGPPRRRTPSPRRCFARVGEWREAGQRIVVLRSEDRLYLLCRRCAAPSALRPAARPGMGIA